MKESDALMLPLSTDDDARRKRRQGLSWFNGRRGVRNFLLLAAALFFSAFVLLLSLPLEVRCHALPWVWACSEAVDE